MAVFTFKTYLFCVFLFVSVNQLSGLDLENEFYYEKFPTNFLWGFATAAYQIEGGWNASGKGHNIWDEFTHRNPSPIVDGSSGDVACNSYEKYEEDVQLIKDMGADYYRFSISWARVIPTGKTDGTIGINPEGVKYYNDLIDKLIENQITPMVTMYHWDLPLALQEEYGGWPNEALIEHFTSYARFLYTTYGDRVKYWITFNEAFVVCMEGYSTGIMAPGIKSPAELPYQCAHTILKSHSAAYHLYTDEGFRTAQGGKVGITIDTGYYHPKNENDPADVEAAERAQHFKHGWYASPVINGNYPQVMIDRIAAHSPAEQSRLPVFTEEEQAKLKGSLDFLGLNHYTSHLVTSATGTVAGWDGDQDTAVSQSAEWPTSAASWLKTVPWGFRRLLIWIKNTYGNIEVYVTENGFADTPTTGLNDVGRVNYYTSYINEMLKAIKLDGCNVSSYTAWSLMDNFEWARGYSERFGIHSVDFNDPNRPRTPKESAKVIKKIFADHGFIAPNDEITTPSSAATIYISNFFAGLLAWMVL